VMAMPGGAPTVTNAESETGVKVAPVAA